MRTVPAIAADEVAPGIAVFPFELVDTSRETGPDVHGARIARATGEMRRLLDASGRYRVVDLAPVAGRIEAAGYLHACNGCEVDIARSVGAERAMTATVHKISSLILYISVVVKETAGGKPVFVGTVSIRGDTDEAWLRGVRYIVDNKLPRTSKSGS